MTTPKLDSISANAIAYYPGETPLFEGQLSVTEAFGEGERLKTAFIEVEGDQSLDLLIDRQVQHPVRTQYAGYFLRRVGDLLVCNVDLEIPVQPPLETVARALLAAMALDLPQRVAAA